MNMVYKNHTINIAEVDIDKYIAEARPYLKQAINDPTTITSRNLSEVASVIVSRAWEDKGYYTTAATLCNFIAQKEYEEGKEIEIPNYSFRRSVVNTCMSILEESAAMRECSIQYWINFVQFLAEIYKRMRFDGNQLRGLADILFVALTSLAKPPRVKNFDEVEMLTSVLHDLGSDLEDQDSDQMHKLISAIRDTFLEPTTCTETRVILLPIIEKSASSWNLADSANKYYFGL